MTRVAAWDDKLMVAACNGLLTVLSSPLLQISQSETMSELDWGQGKWRVYGKALEMALQSQEARACSR